ncbi:trans-aconitate 2-methyltransferase [Micromonospora sp. NPDC004704]
MWDPNTYLRYGDERSRPFHDLVARVPADRPRTVVDLGCGPGNLTVTLRERWPQARISGYDSSPEMIDKALGLGSGADFAVADVRDWVPAPTVDVVVSNAVLQWVPGHEALLRRWAGELPAGSWLAVQVPGNFDAASHRALRAVAADPRWSERLHDLLRSAPVLDVVGYATLLTGAGCAVDAWETTYVHLLPARDVVDHPVLSWMEGTALRPVRASLGGDTTAWADFRAALNRRLAEAYPVRDGLVYFPFHRHFFVARTGAHAVTGAPPAVRKNP